MITRQERNSKGLHCGELFFERDRLPTNQSSMLTG